MEEKTKKWIEAAKILGINPAAEVVCPECGVGKLLCKDEPIEIWGKIDRYLVCDNCGKWNVMTMDKPAIDEMLSDE